MCRKRGCERKKEIVARKSRTAGMSLMEEDEREMREDERARLRYEKDQINAISPLCSASKKKPLLTHRCLVMFICGRLGGAGRDGEPTTPDNDQCFHFPFFNCSRSDYIFEWR